MADTGSSDGAVMNGYSKTKKQQVSYMGRPATVWQYRTNKSSTCERVIAFLWHDNSELQLRHMKGDGRIADEHTIYSDISIANGTDGHADRFAFYRLSI